MYLEVIQSILRLKFLDLFIFYVQVFFLLCAYVCLCTMRFPGVHGIQEWVLELLELEIKML